MDKSTLKEGQKFRWVATGQIVIIKKLGVGMIDDYGNSTRGIRVEDHSNMAEYTISLAYFTGEGNFEEIDPNLQRWEASFDQMDLG